MAKKQKGYKSSIRNRGEDIGYPQGGPYSYRPENQYKKSSQERAITRKEVRQESAEMYKLEQERDERTFDRVKNARNEFYTGIDPRRRQEVADAGMVQEDHQAMANLSPVAIHTEYPLTPYYYSPYVADSRRGGIDDGDDYGNSFAGMLRNRNPYGEF